MDGEGSEAPKKIALKVPSLFIKGPSSQPTAHEEGKPETAEQQKPSRPMPASMRRKLEEAKQKENSDNASEISSVSSSPSEFTQRSRPGPASAKRKLQSTPKSVKATDDDDTKSNVSTGSSSQNESKPKSRPMPASARKKLEEVVQDSEVEGKNNGVDKESPETTEKGLNSVKRPMPAFAKKRLEEKKNGETDNGLETPTSGENVQEQRKLSRPMPASARKKLETTNSEETDEKMDDTGSNVSSRTESMTKSEEAKVKIKKPMPASAKRKFETGIDTEKMDVDDDEETNEQKGPQDESQTQEDKSGEPGEMNSAATDVKKINISLGGIKFPTFNKPMPASAKRKVETEANEDEKPSNMPPHQGVELKEQNDSPVRSSRRSRGSTTELLALGDDKYPCDICGQEFYSMSQKLRHEKSHLGKGADGEDVRIDRKSNTERSTSKSKKKVVHDEFKGKTNCPHCNKHFSSKKWKILKAHATKCGRPAIFGCQFCDRKFKYTSEAEKHEKTHLKAKKDGYQQEFINDRVPSPMSHDSKNDDSKSSTKGSVTEKAKPMPRSVKAKIEKDTKEDNETTDNDLESKVLSSDTRSFKRKIAEVLSNLGTRYNKLQSSSEANDDAEIESPPRKKTALSKSKDDNDESIRGHPMPASVKKKLEDRGRPMPSSPTLEDDRRGDVDPLECAVCHRVFTHKHNRIRHERNVHSIEHPSQEQETETPSDNEPVSPKAEKIYKEDTPTPVKIGPLPHKFPGNCPICSKFIQTSLKRHIQNVHKIPVPSVGSTPVKSPVNAKPGAPKSYKIYKTATNKIKQKLASSSSTSVKKPVVSSFAKVEVEVEKKTENKIIASTASSDLRCACCDKIFQVNCDFYEHMKMVHPRNKRLVTCKLCEHKFSHEEDFLLHIQFKHQELVAGMKQKPDSPAKKESPKRSSDHAREVSTPSASRTTRKSSVAQEQKSGVGVRNSIASKQLSVGISSQEKKLAEDALKRQASRKPETSKQPIRSTRTNSMKSSTSEPEVYEETYNNDDHFDDDGPMEVEESEIAITSTFSQKVSPTRQEKFKVASSDLDAMHCSTCSEVFYSYEALRKHELYFHNVKSTKMCPICGVYPSKLARHLLAHENKTVRCSCAPCNLSFQDFSQLLKHNLEKHPGANGGPLYAPNKPTDETQNSTQAVTFNATDTYRCMLCSKEFTGGSNARRHIRRSHPEQESEAETLVKKVAGDGEKVDKEVEDILEDTNKKLMDPDWDDSDNDAQTETPIPSQPAGNLRKSSRPMPASARAKLGQQKDDQVSIHSDACSDSSRGTSKQGDKPMPASVRAKLEAQRKLETPPLSAVSAEGKKPSRPMPASARAKLAAQNSVLSENSNSRDSSVDNSVSKPRRPMPASVRAKLGIGNAAETAMSTVSSSSGNSSKVQQARPSSPQEVVTIDDDDDDVPVDDSFPEPETYVEPTPPSVPTFSIADEIAEHNRAVRLAMGESNHPVESGGFNSFHLFQCKLCDKKFDTADETRRHIRRNHSEYNEDHVENMIGQLFDEYANTSRRRKSNVRYNDDYVDDIDDEVIIPRGTSRRPKAYPGLPPVPPASKSKRSNAQDSGSGVEFACKWCGARKDSPANVRRHIGKAHPEMHGDQRENGVITLEADQDFEVQDPPPPPERPSNPIYVCKICSRCMTVRQSLYMHIARSHPEVGKGNVTSYIQELNGNSENSPVKAKPVEVETPDNSYYCSICSFQTSDEVRYVSHYKNHCGVSPYQCQYCSATFDRHQQLNEHLTREHTGAEFLTADEAEISMEEVMGSNQISVGTTSKVQIETQKSYSLLRKNSSDSNGHSEVTPKRRPPGPASRKTAAAKKEMPTEIPMDTGNSPSPSPPPPPEDDEMETNEQITSPRETQNEPAVYSYQGDLSSLFPTLGGGPAPGGIDALDDIDGGMSLD